MIYFDNAATTYPKPMPVVNAIMKGVTVFGGNPGRGGYPLAMRSSAKVYETREKIAAMFFGEANNVVFTQNCTYALNMAIKGLRTPFCHYIISDVEHNAVYRPVHKISSYTVVDFNRAASAVAATAATAVTDATAVPRADVTAFADWESEIRPETVAVITTAAGNVTGTPLPLSAIHAVCERRGICHIVDAAQGAGIIPLRLGEHANIICAPGHKGLYGVMGTGFFITDGKYPLDTIIEGGSGSLSLMPEQPPCSPERFEAGTVNVAGIIALGAGIDFVNRVGIDRIAAHEQHLCRLFAAIIRGGRRIILYENDDAAMLPFNIDGTDSDRVADALAEKGFALRGGYHCAYLGHKKLGTLDTGAVRFAPSYMNNEKETKLLANAVLAL
ncbi:cysteine desulfurase [Clostridia bacterium]|nr:cysteine desulfurase [Clostridia bacterium]